MKSSKDTSGASAGMYDSPGRRLRTKTHPTLSNPSLCGTAVRYCFAGRVSTYAALLLIFAVATRLLISAIGYFLDPFATTVNRHF